MLCFYACNMNFILQCSTQTPALCHETVASRLRHGQVGYTILHYTKKRRNLALTGILNKILNTGYLKYHQTCNLSVSMTTLFTRQIRDSKTLRSISSRHRSNSKRCISLDKTCWHIHCLSCDIYVYIIHIWIHIWIQKTAEKNHQYHNGI